MSFPINSQALCSTQSLSATSFGSNFKLNKRACHQVLDFVEGFPRVKTRMVANLDAMVDELNLAKADYILENTHPEVKLAEQMQYLGNITNHPNNYLIEPSLQGDARQNVHNWQRVSAHLQQTTGRYLPFPSASYSSKNYVSTLKDLSPRQKLDALAQDIRAGILELRERLVLQPLNDIGRKRVAESQEL